MPRRGRARNYGQKDANHDEIVAVWISLGCSVEDLSHVSGALDLLLGCAGIDQRVEIKNPNADRGKPSSLKLTKAEQDTFDNWKGRPPVVITTIDEAIELVHTLRRESNVVPNGSRK